MTADPVPGDPVPGDPVPGRSLVTTRAIRDLVRSATLSVYGVSGFTGGGPIGRLLERFGLAHPGLHLEVGETLAVDLQLTVAYGLPIAEVARQVDSAIRYALRTAIDRDVRRLTIHIDGLRFGPGGGPPSVVHVDRGAVGPRDLADSGTDVA